MVSSHFRKLPDDSDTEPAVKPKRPREAPGRRPKERQTFMARLNENCRSKSRERKDLSSGRKNDMTMEDKNIPLLEEKVPTARRSRRSIPPGERRVRALVASPPKSPQKRIYDYTPPPPSASTESSHGERYVGATVSDDAATASSSLMYLPQKNQTQNQTQSQEQSQEKSQVDDILSPPVLSAMTSQSGSYTDDSYSDGGDGSYTEGTYGTDGTDGSAANSTFSDAETGLLSSALGLTNEAGDFQTLADAGYTDEWDEDEITAKYKSQSTEEGGWSVDHSYVPFRQNIAGLSISISAIQLAIMLIQLTLCGMASIEVNPMIGPYPDAFSEWGGKNAYLMLDGHQYFRLLTPVFLHVGIVHWLSNAFCQLQICALFERQWGSSAWLMAYVVGGMGAVATSCVIDKDQIGVSSSGALMGLFGAKIAQIVTYNLFQIEKYAYLEDDVRMDQLGGVLCGAAGTFLFTFLTYVDLSGHLGGCAFGFLAGVILFCNSIESKCLRLLWALIGFGGIIGGAITLSYLLWVETYPDDELGDACQYFRSLYPEGYDCECQWS